MSRYLNVSIIQMPVSSDITENLKYIKESVDNLMMGSVKPELIIGVEYGISKIGPERIPGRVTDFLSSIAKEYGIYFIPGTMQEYDPYLKEGEYYNTCPVFNPSGEMIAKYRKKAPFWPVETNTPSFDDDYCIIEIPEKDIKIGLLICYDQFFPEISRTLALEGAEMIVCPAADPMEFDHISEIIPRTRALENELYFIWTSGTSKSSKGTTFCGNSTMIGPEGEVIYRAGQIPLTYTKTLDFDLVSFKREYGRDQHIKALKEFNIKYPYADKVEQAPVYKNLNRLCSSPVDYVDEVRKVGIGTIGKKLNKEMIEENNYIKKEQIKKNLKDFLNKDE